MITAKNIYFTEDEIHRASSISLVDLLLGQGEKVKKEGREYRWFRYDSTTISGNKWYRHSEGVGGDAIGFVMHFYNLSFQDAIVYLLSDARGYSVIEAGHSPIEKQAFFLPKPNGDCRRLYAYLTKVRCIDAKIIACFIKAKMLYEDKDYHNVIFVGFDEEGKAQYAHKRSTYANYIFRQTVAGSDTRYGFCYKGGGKRLFVFEAPIDMLSFITIYQENWQEHSYLALGGLMENPLDHFLWANSGIREVNLCLDNDKAGRNYADKLFLKLTDEGYEIKILFPHLKDWNEELKKGRMKMLMIKNLMEQGQELQMQGLSEGYKKLAEFGGFVLAGKLLKSKEYEFVNWQYVEGRQEVMDGHYFGNNLAAAKEDFALRAGLIDEAKIFFTNEDLSIIYKVLDYTLTNIPDFSSKEEKLMARVLVKITDGAPEVATEIEAQYSDPDLSL